MLLYSPSFDPKNVQVNILIPASTGSLTHLLDVIFYSRQTWTSLNSKLNSKQYWIKATLRYNIAIPYNRVNIFHKTMIHTVHNITLSLTREVAGWEACFKSRLNSFGNLNVVYIILFSAAFKVDIDLVLFASTVILYLRVIYECILVFSLKSGCISTSNYGNH